MKKVLSLALALTVLLTAASACAPNQSVFEKRKHTYTKAQISAHPLKESEPLTFDCLFREDLPEIPYIDAQDYLNRIFTEEVGFRKGKNGSYHFTNGGYTLTIDAENDTISCDCIEGFILENHKPPTKSSSLSRRTAARRSTATAIPISLTSTRLKTRWSDPSRRRSTTPPPTARRTLSST